MHYKYIDGKIIKCKDMMEWALWFENATDRILGNDVINDVHISTVFLGIDHAFTMDDKPILFETMIFGGEFNDFQRRYCTPEEAKAGHTKAVEMVLATMKTEPENRLIDFEL